MVDITKFFSQQEKGIPEEIPLDVASSIDLVKEGNRDAFDILYNTYVKDMYKHVMFRVPEEHVQDILSDIFFRVWKKIQSFQGNNPSQFRAWIFTISQHIIIDFYRKNKQITSLDESFQIIDSHAYANPEGQTEETLLMQRVAEKMHLLSQKHQEILTLKYFQDISYEEIASIMSISEGNARILLHRALKELRELLENEDQNNGTD